MKKSNSSRIMMDFSFAFNTDLAIIKYLLKLYPKSRFFHTNCSKWSDYYLKCKLITRVDINPITVLLEEQYLDQADGLYKELYEKHWSDVLNITQPIYFTSVLRTTYRELGYHITINCRNTKEQQFVEKYCSEWSTEVEMADVRSFGILYIYHCWTSVTSLKYIEGKSIYVLRMKPNLLNMKENVLSEAVIALQPTNIFNTIDVYPDFELPEELVIDQEMDINSTESQEKSYKFKEEL